MASSAHLVPQVGPDGLAMDAPAIAYTEKVLEEKELELKKYIQDNYSKIRNVERELASLAFEIKLTAGPKKAALEHLRKKIELSAEKIKVAKQREEQAKKVWEAAVKVLKEEEENKQRLCEDLNRLVQESAASQYLRLEELKNKLEALNPEVTGGAFGLTTNGREASGALPKAGDQLQQALIKEESKPNMVTSEKTTEAADAARASNPVPERENKKVITKSAVPDEEKVISSQQASPGESRSRNSIIRPANSTRGHGSLVKGGLGQKPKANNWTGAGFDVDDNTING